MGEESIETAFARGSSRRRRRIAAGVLGLILAAAPASAFEVPLDTTFRVDPGPNLPTGSGVAISADGMLYGSVQRWPTHLAQGVQPNLIELTVSDVTIPSLQTQFDNLYDFELVDGNDMPVDGFTLTLDTDTGEINFGRTDPQLRVHVELTNFGIFQGEGYYDFDLTTGTINDPLCQPGAPIEGAPLLDTWVTLVAGFCMEEFAGNSFDLPFQWRLDGQIFAPEPGRPLLGATALVALAVCARRRSPARIRRA